MMKLWGMLFLLFLVGCGDENSSSPSSGAAGGSSSGGEVTPPQSFSFKCLKEKTNFHLDNPLSHGQIASRIAKGTEDCAATEEVIIKFATESFAHLNPQEIPL